MKVQNFSIQVPEPCHEDWGKMTPKDKGRFCTSCTKTVVDFTKMKNNEISTYMEENENICGRFTKNQLNTVYSIPKKQRFQLAKFAAACLLVFGFNLFSYSCAIETPFTDLIELTENQSLLRGAPIRIPEPTDTVKKQDSTKTINVVEIKKLEERNSQHITGISIRIPENTLPIHPIKDDSLSINECSDTLTFDAVEIVKHKDIQRIEDMEIMGIPARYDTRPDVYQLAEFDQEAIEKKYPQIGEDISPFKISVFPNPTNNITNIEFTPDSLQSEVWSVKLLLRNSNGQAVKLISYPFYGKSFSQQINTSTLPPGTYFFRNDIRCGKKKNKTYCKSLNNNYYYEKNTAG